MIYKYGSTDGSGVRSKASAKTVFAKIVRVFFRPRDVIRKRF